MTAAESDRPPSVAPSATLAAAYGAVLVDPRPDLCTLVLKGSDRVAWLNGLVTCDLARRAPGVAAYGLLLEKKGKIRADLLAVDHDDALVLVVPRAARELVHEVLDHHLVMDDVELEEGAHDVALLHGPRAAELAAELALPSFVDARWGLGSRLVLLAPGGAAASALSAAAEARGGTTTAPPGDDALSVDRFVPRFGRDFDAAHYPQEAALEERAVSFSKGCYLGQEVVYMLEHRGREKQRLVPLAIAGDALPEAGAPVHDASGAEVGTLKSAAWGRGGVRGIALVKRAQAEPGTPLQVDGRAADVVAVPVEAVASGEPSTAPAP